MDITVASLCDVLLPALEAQHWRIKASASIVKGDWERKKHIVHIKEDHGLLLLLLLLRLLLILLLLLLMLLLIIVIVIEI